MAVEKIIAYELTVDVEEAKRQYNTFLDKQTAVRKEIVKLQEANKKLRKAQREALKEAQQGVEGAADKYQNLTKQVVANDKTLKDLRFTQRQLNKDFEAVQRGLSEYKKLEKQLYQARTAYKNLAAAGKENTKEAQQLLEKVTELDEKLKGIDASVGNYQRNVGNYGSALEGLKTGFENAGVGTSVLDNGLKTLAANPIILVFTVLVTVLGQLFQAFKRSERGAKLMAKVGASVDAVMSSLVSIAVKLADVATKAFENPIESIEKLGEAIIKNVVNRFKSVLVLAGAARKAISGEFKAAAKEAREGYVQLFTGLDGEQQKKVVDGIKDVTEGIKEQVTAFQLLEEAKRNQVVVNGQLGIAIAKQARAEQLASNAADNTTLSFKEREEAAEKARIALEKRAKTEIDLAKGQLGLINQELKLRRANGENVIDLLGQQKNAIKGVIEAETDYLIAVQDNEKQRSELKQDRLERDLDILIDGFDNQKTINERLLQNDQLTYSQRVKVLDDTKTLFEQSYNEQIATIKKFTNVAFNESELIAEQDAVTLRNKIRNLGLSEIIEGRLLEIIRDRRTAIQDLSEDEQKLNEEARNQSVKTQKLKFEELKQIEEIKFKERLISKTQYELSILNIEKENLKKQLENEKLSEQELSNLRNEIRLKELDETIKHNERKIEIENETYERQKAQILQQQFEQLSQEGLTEAERTRIKEEANQKLELLELERLQKQLSGLQENSVEYLQLSATIADLDYRIVADAEAKKREELEKTRQKREAVTTAILDSARSVSDTLIGFMKDEDKQKETSQKVAEKIDAAQDILTQYRIARNNIEIVSNNIKAVSEGAKVPFPGNIIAIAAILGAIAKGVQSARKLSKFEKGTVLKGPSHADEGIPLFERYSGRFIGEAEGDEIIQTKGVYRNSKARAISSLLNVNAGGVDFGGSAVPKPLSEAILQFINTGFAPPTTSPRVSSFVPKFATGTIIRDSEFRRNVGTSDGLERFTEALHAYANRPIYTDIREVNAANNDIEERNALATVI